MVYPPNGILAVANANRFALSLTYMFQMSGVFTDSLNYQPIKLNPLVGRDESQQSWVRGRQACVDISVGASGLGYNPTCEHTQHVLVSGTLLWCVGCAA